MNWLEQQALLSAQWSCTFQQHHWSHPCMTTSSCWLWMPTWDKHIHHKTHYKLLANLSQIMQLVIGTFLGQRQCYADTKAENFAGTAGARMDCYGVHKVWPNAHRHRICLHGRDLTLLYMQQELQVESSTQREPAPTALSLNGINGTPITWLGCPARLFLCCLRTGATRKEAWQCVIGLRVI